MRRPRSEERGERAASSEARGERGAKAREEQEVSEERGEGEARSEARVAEGGATSDDQGERRAAREASDERRGSRTPSGECAELLAWSEAEPVTKWKASLHHGDDSLMNLTVHWPSEGK